MYYRVILQYYIRVPTIELVPDVIVDPPFKHAAVSIIRYCMRPTDKLKLNMFDVK